MEAPMSVALHLLLHLHSYRALHISRFAQAELLDCTDT